MKPVVLFVELKIAAKNKYICEITEKLYHNDISVCIYSPENYSQLDNLLWTWKQESFIPHQVVQNSPSGEPVLICPKQEDLVTAKALILQEPLPLEILEKYNLVIDFAEVFHSDRVEESRKRFKQVRDSGKFDVHFTQLGAILAKKNIVFN